LLCYRFISFEIAFIKLGLTPEVASFLLLGTLLGSGINLPLYSLHTKETGHLVFVTESKARLGNIPASKRR